MTKKTMEPLNYIIVNNYAQYCAIKVYLEENGFNVINLVDPLVKKDIKNSDFYFVFDHGVNKMRCIYNYQLNSFYNYPIVNSFSFNQLQDFVNKIKQLIENSQKLHFNDLEIGEYFVYINDPNTLRIKMGENCFTILNQCEILNKEKKGVRIAGNFLNISDCFDNIGYFVKRVKNVNVSFEIEE